jgi:hypothetical protein
MFRLLLAACGLVAAFEGVQHGVTWALLAGVLVAAVAIFAPSSGESDTSYRRDRRM